MKVALYGSRWFGQQVLRLLRERGDFVVQIAAPAGDRLHIEARRSGLSSLEESLLAADLIPPCDLIVCAHSHKLLKAQTRERARLGAIGYHPSLLPRHRGPDAVRWTIEMGDPIAGGSVYRLDDGIDTGPVLLQDHCHVRPSDTAETLWIRELAPMGLRLLQQVLHGCDDGGELPEGITQDIAVATYEGAFSPQAALRQRIMVQAKRVMRPLGEPST